MFTLLKRAAVANLRAPSRRWTFVAVAAVMLATTAAGRGHAQDAAGQPAQARSVAQQAAAFVPNEVLVRFRPGTLTANRNRAQAAVAAVQRRAVAAPDSDLELLITSLPVANAIAALEALPEVEFAEPNWILRHYATSNDPSFANGSLWGMYGEGSVPANQFGSQAAEAWERGFTGSSAVYVGVIDEGIDFTHPDLSANVWNNPFDPVDGIDNDGNSYADDVHGWDFFHGDNSIYDGSPSDLDVDFHGTHVAGTIGARGGNGIGVAGVNWNVTLISGKFLGPGGGSTAHAIAAIRYFADLKARHGLNIVAVNNSWGGGAYSIALHQAIIQAAKQGILFIAAAGNGGLDGIADDNDAIASYPSGYSTLVDAGSETAASYEAVIAVASMTSAGALSSFSNYGATTVDVAAPGSDIVSTAPQNGYRSISGTSMATPHVTGAAALYKSINSGASAPQIRQAILAQAIATPSLTGRMVTGARLNVGDFSTGVSLTISDVRVTEGDSGTKAATFAVSLSDASPSAFTVAYATVDGTATSGTSHANGSAISIPSSGSASPYPSTIAVPGGLGTITKLTVRLSGFSHAYPSDVDVLLVGPGGQTCVLMSDVGSSVDAVNLTFTFDDSAPALLGNGALSSGTFKPTNAAGDFFATPAPAGPYGTTLAGFTGTDPEGTWRLFVYDDTGFDAGLISGGWSIVVSTTLGDYNATSGALTFPAGATSQTVAVTINGDATIEATETFKINLFDASGANILDGEAIGTIRNDDFTDASLAGVWMKAAHITELRAAINEARVEKGLSAFAFTDAALTPQNTLIRAVHIIEMRNALAEAYVASQLVVPTYTDPTITAGATTPRAVHITELRAAVLNLP